MYDFGQHGWKKTFNGFSGSLMITSVSISQNPWTSHLNVKGMNVDACEISSCLVEKWGFFLLVGVYKIRLKFRAILSLCLPKEEWNLPHSFWTFWLKPIIIKKIMLFFMWETKLENWHAFDGSDWDERFLHRKVVQIENHEVRPNRSIKLALSISCESDVVKVINWYVYCFNKSRVV